MEPAITRGLIIRQPWADMILSGQKTWELRGSQTRVRGGIAIIAGGSCQIIGVCDLVDVKGPLTQDEYNKAQTERGVTTSEVRPLPYPKTFAWVLARPRRLERPVPYQHPNGAVIWVKLAPGTQQELLINLVADTVR